MKVRSVENTTVNNKAYGSNKTQLNDARHNTVLSSNAKNDTFTSLNNSPSFTGFDPTSAMIDFWAAIARGGLAASFTVQDMLGTNFPRTFAALDRNKDITGKNNYKAAVEVAIREFTTGPSMFIIPALVLAGASRLSGTSNKVPTYNIADLSTIMKGTVANLSNGEFANVDFKNLSPEQTKDATLAVKKAFYRDVFTSIFNQYDKNDIPVNIDEYVEMMLKAENPDTPTRNFFMAMLKKRVKVAGKEVDSKDEILTKITEKFVADKKAHTQGWGGFLSAKLLPDSKKASGIDDILKDLKNYSDDFAKHYIKAQANSGQGKVLVDKFVENFKDMRVGSRAITNISMIVATALFMSIIPKLYTRNKTNPETDAIYAQVNMQRKGAVNEDK